MPGTREFGEVQYTLTDVIVAAYDKSADTYGTPAALAGGQLVDVEPEADNDQLPAYGYTEELLSVVRHAKVKFGAGGVDRSVLAIVNGVANATSGSGDTQHATTRFVAGGSGLPYFGLIGVGATTDGGVAVVGLPGVKLNTFMKFMLDGKENKFNTSEVEGMAIPILLGTSPQLMVVKSIRTAGAWVAPTSGANFKAFFA
jgi:hypothetical protein